MSTKAKAVRRRYQRVLDLLNGGENLERWVLGELVRRTVEQAQDSAAVELEVSPHAFRLRMISEAEELGLKLAEPKS